jgi:hypothetical protein
VGGASAAAAAAAAQALAMQQETAPGCVCKCPPGSCRGTHIPSDQTCAFEVAQCSDTVRAQEGGNPGGLAVPLLVDSAE